jgi:hypothetical protein
MAVIGCVWSLEWSNPYTAPRDGLPRVRAQVFFPMGHPNYGWGGCPAELKALHVPGDGWCISWGSVIHPAQEAEPRNTGSQCASSGSRAG